MAAVTRLNDVIAAYIKRQDDLRDEAFKFLNSMREADVKRLDAIRDANDRRTNDLREAETRRVNELAFQKQNFDLELSRIRDKSVDANALLLATQVKELKADSSERTAKLEQFANEMRGQTSATGPANAKLSEQVGALTQAMAVLAGKTNVTDPITVKLAEDVRLLTQAMASNKGTDTGQSNAMFYVMGFIGLLLTLATVTVAVFVAMRHPAPAQPLPPNGYYPYPPNGGSPLPRNA